jgi:hypothetical protein
LLTMTSMRPSTIWKPLCSRVITRARSSKVSPACGCRHTLTPAALIALVIAVSVAASLHGVATTIWYVCALRLAVLTEVQQCRVVCGGLVLLAAHL